MITCPDCDHQNPEGSVQCERCYSPLISSTCSKCGASVQPDAGFCGQCGFNLKFKQVVPNQNQSNNLATEDPNSDFFVEEDLITTSIYMNTFSSPWDSSEEGVENLSKIDDQEITFDEFMQLTSDESPSNSDEPDLPFNQMEDLANELDESDDLESWISSLQEESGKSQQEVAVESSQDVMEDLEEIPGDFSGPDSLNFTDDPFAPQADVPEVAAPESSSTESSVEVSTEDLPVDPIASEEVIIEESVPEEWAPEVPELPELSELPELPEIESESVASEPEKASLAVSESELENEIKEGEEVDTSPWDQPNEKESEEALDEVAKSSDAPASVVGDSAQTRLQLQRTVLFHLQTKTEIEFPLNLTLIRIGKPNQQVPPDVDVSGFPNAEVVSRVHAHIRVEGDAYFLEDMGSSNGTYVNHSPLPTGNRHRLRSGDRFSLGKGDLMTFIFQLEGEL